LVLSDRPEEISLDLLDFSPRKSSAGLLVLVDRLSNIQEKLINELFLKRLSSIFGDKAEGTVFIRDKPNPTTCPACKTNCTIISYVARTKPLLLGAPPPSVRPCRLALI